MNLKSLYLLLFLPWLISCVDNGLGFDDMTPKQEKDVTYLMYIVGQNDLANDFENNISDLMKGYEETDINANILVYADMSSTPELYLLDKNKSSRVTKKTIRTYPDQISVDPVIMQDIIEYVFDRYPAKRKAVTFSSHADGSLYNANTVKRAFGVENYEGGYYSMNITDIADALYEIDTLDVLMFDACLMANVETVYELKDAARYYLSAPNSIPGAGFPYSSCLHDFLLMDKESLVRVAKMYYDKYMDNSVTWDNFAAVSLLDVLKVNELARSVDVLLQDTIVQQRVLTVKNDTLQSFEPGFDLYDFKHWILSISDSCKARDSVLKAMNDVVIATFHSDYMSVNSSGNTFLNPVLEGRYSGINTYLPVKNNSKTKNRKRFFTKLQWYQEAGHWRHALYDVSVE